MNHSYGLWQDNLYSMNFQKRSMSYDMVTAFFCINSGPGGHDRPANIFYNLTSEIVLYCLSLLFIVVTKLLKLENFTEEKC